MNDRRRINGPAGGTTAPIYVNQITQKSPTPASTQRPSRTRKANALRKMFLKTGVTPSASGSAYLELEAQTSSSTGLASLSTSGLKLTCTVHGPRPLPRSAPFSPHIILSTHVKYAPFATRQRRGYLRDSGERDLAVHLETALRGVIIGDRWPKSGVEVVVTVLEGEEDQWWGDSQGKGGNGGQWGMMSVLSGCITVASAAIADAGIDCVDTVSGGVAALVRTSTGASAQTSLVLDPVPSEHAEILAACVVGYLPSRDEVTDIWVRGEISNSGSRHLADGDTAYDELADGAVQAALGAHQVLSSALREAAELQINGAATASL